jgi:hypothetical protein
MDWEENQESYEDQGQTKELANDFAASISTISSFDPLTLSCYQTTMHCSEQGNGSNGIFGSH